MSGLPIGFYTGLMGVSAVTALGSGIYALLRARNIARWSETPENDVITGPKTPIGHRRVGGTKVAVVVCTIATCVALGLFALVAGGVIGSAQTSNSREVQRP